MRYEYIGPFVTTTVRVLDAVMHSPIRSGDVTLTTGDRIGGDIAIVVRIAGDTDGDIVLSMDAGTAGRVCSVLSGAGSAAPPDRDALCELANMIAGNAVSALNDLGFDFSVLPPAVLDAGASGGRLRGVEALQIPLYTACGEMTMNIALVPAAY